MVKIFSALAAVGMLVAVSGCSGQPVVADISQDKVILQGNGAPPEQLLATANQSCGMYKKHAQALSQRCGDQYCIQKYYLYACVAD